MTDLLSELEAVVAKSARSDEIPYGAIEKAYAFRDAMMAALDLVMTHHAEIAAAVRDAKRWRYVVENSEWIRDEEDTLMAVRFEDARPNLESVGMRTDAIDTAMRAGEGEG